MFSVGTTIDTGVSVFNPIVSLAVVGEVGLIVGSAFVGEGWLILGVALVRSGVCVFTSGLVG